MLQPLALHPSNIGRGKKSRSTIAFQDGLNNDPDMPSDLKARIRANYFISDTNLNEATDEVDFNNMVKESMAGLMEYDLSKCHADGHTCFEPVLPPITVALIDRSGSMTFTQADQLVKSAIPYNECWARVVKVFKDPDESCPLIDAIVNGADNCEAQRDSCLALYENLETPCDLSPAECLEEGPIKGPINTQCQDDYNDCKALILDPDLQLATLIDGLKDKYKDEEDVTDMINDIVLGNRVIDCNTILKDEIGQKRTNDKTGATYICEQTLIPKQCQPDFCPGDCVRSEVVGDSVLKITAADDALREIIAPRLQFGSTFLYTYFAGNNFGSAEPVRLIDCTYTEEDATSEVPFCGDTRALEDEIERVQNVVSTVSAEYPATGGTPLFESIDLTFNRLDTLIAERIALGQPADVAFYLMTDGVASDVAGGHEFNKVCDVLGTTNAFSAGFKARYGQDSKLYILNLPGTAEDCSAHALQVNEPIDVNLVSVEAKTVDAFFSFDTQSEYFSELFGDTGVSADVDGYEMCQQLGFADEDIIVDPFDGDINDGNTNNASCGLGFWQKTCVSLIDGNTYPDTHAYCGPTCLSAYNGKRYIQGHSYCNVCYVDGVAYPTTFSQCNVGGGGDGECLVDGLYYPEGDPMCDSNCNNSNQVSSVSGQTSAVALTTVDEECDAVPFDEQQ